MKLLDLYCGAGGAAMGYHQAGFDEIIGIDNQPQPDYPFEFIRADAMAADLLVDLCSFDLIHASPPCQAHTALTKGTNSGRQYPDLISATRNKIQPACYGDASTRSCTPTVIENVAGAPIRHDLALCGEMFGLDVIRHRHFEVSGWTVNQPEHINHRGRVRGWRHGTYHDGPYLAVYGAGGGKGTVQEWQQAMGIDWTDNRKSIAEAIPPAYTEYIGTQFLLHEAQP